MQLDSLKTPPSKQEFTNYGIGTAAAALLTWIAWKLNLGNN